MKRFTLVFASTVIILVACKKEKPKPVEVPNYALPSNTGNSINLTVYNDGFLSNNIKWSGIIYPDPPNTNASGYRSYFYQSSISYTPDVFLGCTDTTLQGNVHLEYINLLTPSVGGIVEKTTNSFTYVPTNSTYGQASFYNCGWRIANLPNCVCSYFAVIETKGDSFIPSMTYVIQSADAFPSISLPDIIKDKTKELIIPVSNADYVELTIHDSLGYLWKTQAQLSGGNKVTIKAGSLNTLKGSANYNFYISGRVFQYRGQSVNNKNFLYIYQNGQGKTISIQ